MRIDRVRSAPWCARKESELYRPGPQYATDNGARPLAAPTSQKHEANGVINANWHVGCKGHFGARLKDNARKEGPQVDLHRLRVNWILAHFKRVIKAKNHAALVAQNAVVHDRQEMQVHWQLSRSTKVNTKSMILTQENEPVVSAHCRHIAYQLGLVQLLGQSAQS